MVHSFSGFFTSISKHNIDQTIVFINFDCYTILQHLKSLRYKFDLIIYVPCDGDYELILKFKSIFRSQIFHSNT